jgi:DNA replication licensing factor MCM6
MQVEALAKLPETEIRNNIKKEFTNFIQTFVADNETETKYERKARDIINAAKHHIVFGFKDLLHYNSELAALIFSEYYKFEPIINEAFTQYMHELEKNIIQAENGREEGPKDRYECSFDDGFDDVPDLSVRGLKCNLLGKLIKLRGTVTRTSEVRPELKVGVFKCRTCGKLSKPIVQQFKYTEPKRCLT